MGGSVGDDIERSLRNLGPIIGRDWSCGWIGIVHAKAFTPALVLLLNGGDTSNWLCYPPSMFAII